MSPHLKSLSIGLAIFAAQSAFSLAAHAQTSYDLTPIGSLGGSYVSARAINDVGEVVGCSEAVINGTPTLRAFLYRNGETMDIGSLTPAGTACAHDINNAGEITGRSAAPTGEDRAFIYRNGTLTSLGNLGSSSQGNSINDSSQIAGTAMDVGDSFQGAFVYDALLSPTQVDLGSLGGIVIQGRSINSAGDIAGWANNAQFLSTSYLYRNGVLTDLISVLGGSSQAMAINDLGQIVGTRTAGATGGYVFLNGAVTDLPALIEHGRTSPTNINERGQIVGSSRIETGNRAVVISQGQIVDLNVALVASPDKEFVTLEGAVDIKESGWILADGLGRRTGVRSSYLLRPVVGN